MDTFTNLESTTFFFEENSKQDTNNFWAENIIAPNNLLSSPAMEIAFIDGALDSINNLLETINANEIFVLNPNADGIEQISNVIKQRQNITGIHIFSHGNIGNISLGNIQLNLATLSDYQESLQAWSDSLSTEADILFYGCNVGAGDIGKELVQQISQLTNADISASSNLTGNAEQGGDWNLELTVGTVETELAITTPESYSGILETINFTDFTNISTLQLNGDAQQSGNILQLTPNSIFQVGSAYYATPISFDANTSFESTFSFQLLGGSGGADGFAFVVQNSTTGATALGEAGGSLGYDILESGTGIRVNPSVAIEFDTYQNSWDLNDNHLSVLQNGSVETALTTTITELPDFNSGDIIYAWVDYNSSSNVLDVFVSNNQIKPLLPNLSSSLDLFSILGEQAFVGFSAGTGGLTNAHNLISWTFSSEKIHGITLVEGNDNTLVTEEGLTDTYTLVLNTEPTADVTINLTSDSQISTTTSSITFTPENWNIAQTVTVTAVDDTIREGSHTGLITHTVSSLDPNYNGLSLNSVTVSIVDNDLPGVTITQSDGQTEVTEGGTSDTYTLVLDTRPTDDVIINLIKDNQITTNSTSLIFTPENWNIAQTVTVTAVNDTTREGFHTGIIAHSISSLDSDYSGLSILSINVDIIDNDNGIGLKGEYYNNINFTGLSLIRTDATVNFDWGGGSPDPSMGRNTFSVVWTGQVEAVKSEEYTFYTNTDDGVRLYLNDVLIIDGFVDQRPTLYGSQPIALVAGQKYDIRMEYYENTGGAVAQLLWSSPTTPQQIIPQSQLYLPNSNNSLILSITEVSISENGGIATGTITRNSELSNPLTINLSSSDPSGAIVPGSVTIEANQTSASFIITGVNDAIVDGTQIVTITASTIDFSDTATIEVTDDDIATLSLTINSESIAENGGTATATITRNTGTVGDLVVTLSNSDTSEATMPTSVTILDGSDSVTFTITGVDDAIVDGTQIVTITASALGFVDGNDTLSVTDDDIATLSLTINSESITENGGTATATITRNTGTVGDLVVTLSNSDTSEATMPTSVTILDGSDSVTFTITGVDDAIVDGTQIVTITASALGFVDGNDTLSVTDDDIATLTIAIDRPSISENGGSATATITRNSNLINPLTINLSSSDTSEATVPATVTIGANQSSTTFTITGIDDAIVDGTQTVTITASTLDLSDTATIEVTDDDIATLSLTINSESIAENGGTATATITRNTGTVGDLVVTLSNSDTSEATMPTSVTILDGSDSVTFTITGVDDAIVDGTQIVTITASAPGFVDGNDTLSVTDDDFLIPNINFPNFSNITGLQLNGDAQQSGNILQITPNTGGQAGSVYYATPITFDQNTSFESTFSFQLLGGSGGADGFAFVLQNSIAGATALGETGGSLGYDILESSTGIRVAQSVAIEFDTYQNSWDPNDNHLSVLQNGSVNTALVTTNTTTDLPDFNSGDLIYAWVDYNGTTNILDVFVNTQNTKPTSSNLSYVLDLPQLLSGNQAFVGFSAGTGGLTNAHNLMSWTFSSEKIPGITLVEGNDNTLVTEEGLTDTYTLVLNTEPTADVTINLTSDSQISITTSSITFTPENWNIAQTVTVTAIDDTIREGSHTGLITHTVSSLDPNYNGLSLTSVTVNIVDNDLPGVTITQSDGKTEVTEGGATDTYTLVLDKQPTTDVIINLASNSQTTTNVPSLTFTPGNWNTPQTVTVTAVNDTEVEGTHLETIAHTISTSDSDYSGLSVASVNVDIIDNDAVIPLGNGLLGEYYDNIDFTNRSFIRTDATVNFDWGNNSPALSMENDSFSVVWTGQVEALKSEEYTFYTNTDDGVRLFVNGVIVINGFVDQPPTLYSSQPIALVAGQRYDIRMEYYENSGGAIAQLLWSSPTIPQQIIPQSQLYNTLNVFSLKDSKTIFVSETASVVRITAVRTGDTQTEETLQYTTNELGSGGLGQATANSDYITPNDTGTANTGLVVFGIGESEATFDIQIFNDSNSEGIESFAVGIQNPSGGTLGTTRTVLISIVDDDVTPTTLSVNEANLNVVEGISTVNITVVRSGNINEAVSVNFNTSNGTAIAGEDYTTTSGTLNFAIGEITQIIEIPITDDSTPELSKYFSLTLSNPCVGSILGQSTSTITILDNDDILSNLNRVSVVSELNQPTTIDWSPDGRYMLIAQKNGIVKAWDKLNNTINTVIDLSAEVNDTRDRGLLGMAIHPDFLNGSPYLYLSYTYDPEQTLSLTGLAGPDGNGNRAARVLKVEMDPDTMIALNVDLNKIPIRVFNPETNKNDLPNSMEVIVGTNSIWEYISRPDGNSTGDLSIAPSGIINGTTINLLPGDIVDQGIQDNYPTTSDIDNQNVRDFLAIDSESHTIGDLHFGSDGYLYLSNGDGTSYNFTDSRAVRVQDLNNLSGKVLRIDPITGEGVSGNPFFEENDPYSNQSKVFYYGLRNPFRFTFDPTTNLPVIGDVGWNSWEEINTGVPGSNFGWPYLEGPNQTGGYSSLTQAIAFYNNDPENVNPGSEHQVSAIFPLLSRSHGAPDNANAIMVGDFFALNTLVFGDVNNGQLYSAIFDENRNIVEIKLFDNVPFLVDMVMGPDGLLYGVNLVSGEIVRWEPDGITLTETDGSTNVAEGGANDTYTLVLDTEPTSDVTVEIVINDGQTTTDVTSVTFTSTNWNIPQTITITAVDDVVNEGFHPGSIAHTVISLDPGYSGLSSIFVIADIIDNDDLANLSLTFNSSPEEILDAQTISMDIIQTQDQANNSAQIENDFSFNSLNNYELNELKHLDAKSELEEIVLSENANLEQLWELNVAQFSSPLINIEVNDDRDLGKLFIHSNSFMTPTYLYRSDTTDVVSQKLAPKSLIMMNGKGKDTSSPQKMPKNNHDVKDIILFDNLLVMMDMLMTSDQLVHDIYYSGI